PALFRAAVGDRPAVAKRRGRRPVRGPPAARRVGRLDHRAKRRAEHAVLAADDGRVSMVRPAPLSAAIPARRGSLYPGPDGEPDPGHLAVRPAAAGLWAAAGDRLAGRGRTATAAVAGDRRKAPAPGAGGRRKRANREGPVAPRAAAPAGAAANPR